MLGPALALAPAAESSKVMGRFMKLRAAALYTTLKPWWERRYPSSMSSQPNRNSGSKMPSLARSMRLHEARPPQKKVWSSTWPSLMHV